MSLDFAECDWACWSFCRPNFCAEVDMTQAEKAKQFATLHIKGTPLILLNAWTLGPPKLFRAPEARRSRRAAGQLQRRRASATVSTFHSRSSNKSSPGLQRPLMFR